MTPEEHKQKHIELHKALDELVADFIGHNSNFENLKTMADTSVMELMIWSSQQAKNPTEMGRW